MLDPSPAGSERSSGRPTGAPYRRTHRRRQSAGRASQEGLAALTEESVSGLPPRPWRSYLTSPTSPTLRCPCDFWGPDPRVGSTPADQQCRGIAGRYPRAPHRLDRRSRRQTDRACAVATGPPGRPHRSRLARNPMTRHPFSDPPADHPSGRAPTSSGCSSRAAKRSSIGRAGYRQSCRAGVTANGTTPPLVPQRVKKRSGEATSCQVVYERHRSSFASPQLAAANSGAGASGCDMRCASLSDSTLR